MKFLIILTLFLCHTMTLQAQSFFPEENGVSLTGVKEVDARLVTSVWLSMDQDRENFQRNADNAFKLGLRRDGITVSESAPNYLFCTARIVQSSGIVFFSISLEYYDFNPDGLHVLKWTHGVAGSIGKNNFSHSELAKDCVDTFSAEWLKWNPRR
jgi:hypothetical protein